jgi:hypothetical protein
MPTARFGREPRSSEPFEWIKEVYVVGLHRMGSWGVLFVTDWFPVMGDSQAAARLVELTKKRGKEDVAAEKPRLPDQQCWAPPAACLDSPVGWPARRKEKHGH